MYKREDGTVNIEILVQDETLWLTQERAGEFCAMALSYVLIAWIRSGMHEPPEEMAEIYRFMTTHSMMDLTEEV